MASLISRMRFWLRGSAVECHVVVWPVHDGDRADCGLGTQLGGDGHQDQVRPLAVIGLGADDNRGTLLGGGLVGERERDNDDVAEMVRHGGPLCLVVDIVFGIVPNLGKGRHRSGSGGMDKLAVGISQGEEVHEVLDLCNAGRR